MREAGANIFVAGTSLLFRPGGMEDHIDMFHQKVR
jgi:pentose-5-phosphate-3-epimerase